MKGNKLAAGFSRAESKLGVPRVSSVIAIDSQGVSVSASRLGRVARVHSLSGHVGNKS